MSNKAQWVSAAFRLLSGFEAADKRCIATASLDPAAWDKHNDKRVKILEELIELLTAILLRLR